MLEIKEEIMTDEWFDESEPLLQIHFKELEVFGDLPLITDRDVYLTLQDVDKILMVTARKGGELIGYIIYIVGEPPHHKGSLCAQQDAYFVHQDYRKSMASVGYRLLKKSEELLKDLGVRIIYQSVKVNADFGPFLEKTGYTQTEKLYRKRIG